MSAFECAGILTKDTSMPDEKLVLSYTQGNDGRVKVSQPAD